MNHPVFQPRPTGSDARRRHALSISTVVLLALAWWNGSLQSASPLTPARAAGFTQPPRGTVRIGAPGAARPAPELIGDPQDWVNTHGEALHLYAPGGRPQNPRAVYLIDFWEYTCNNCLNTLPYLKSWDAKYRKDGLIIIGIHTPEFPFAHNSANVRAAITRLGINYPVLLDNSSANWNAYYNNSWPHHYLLDARGHLLDDLAGEGGYQETEQHIRAALRAAHPGLAFGPLTALVRDSDKPGAVCYPRTDETYAGYARGGLANPNSTKDAPALYTDPALQHHGDGEITASGHWTLLAQSLRPATANLANRLALRYHALQCNAVLKPEASAPCPVIVQQDGKPVPRADAGADIRYNPQGQSYIMVDTPRMYQLTHNKVIAGHGLVHELALQTPSGSLGVYSFSFDACTQDQ